MKSPWRSALLAGAPHPSHSHLLQRHFPSFWLRGVSPRGAQPGQVRLSSCSCSTQHSGITAQWEINQGGGEKAMWDYSCGCPRAPGFVWGLWGFFLLLFSQLSSLGMESANHGRGLAMEKGIWGRVGASHGPGGEIQPWMGGGAPSPSSIPAGDGVNTESSRQL